MHGLLLACMAAPAGKPPPALGFVALDEHAKGVVGPAAAARASAERIVIPLFSNRGFLPFLRNLICSMRRLNVENWLVIAMDNSTCPALQNTVGGELPPSACVHPYSMSGAVTSEQGVATYRSVAFNRMVMQRPLWVRWLLLQGYKVIQCDLDIVWIHDPQPLLLTSTIAPHHHHSRHAPKADGLGAGAAGGAPRVVPDMLFQSEQAYGLNGGFYFARPTNATLVFFDAWIERLTVMINLPSFEEQHALNSAVMRLRRGYAPPADSGSSAAAAGGGSSGGSSSSGGGGGRGSSGGGSVALRYAALHESLFPNGKIWCEKALASAHARSALCWHAMGMHTPWSPRAFSCRHVQVELSLAGGQAACVHCACQLEQAAEEVPDGARPAVVPSKRRHVVRRGLQPARGLQRRAMLQTVRSHRLRGPRLE